MEKGERGSQVARVCKSVGRFGRESSRKQLGGSGIGSGLPAHGIGRLRRSSSFEFLGGNATQRMRPQESLT